MTKVELINKLAGYPDNKQVYITLPGAKQYFTVDEVITAHGGNPSLETIEAPDFDDLCGMADSCWDEHKKRLTEPQKDALIYLTEKPIVEMRYAE